MKFLIKNLTMEFSDPKMEKEFTAIKEKDVSRDFNMSVGFLILLNIALIISAIISNAWVDVYICGAAIVFLIVIFLARRPLIGFVHHLTLIVIFSYNVSRIILIGTHYEGLNQGSLFLTGYSIASMQIILINRIPKIYYKFFGVIAGYALRLVTIYAIIDSNAFSVPTIIRQFLVDGFIMFIFYSDEKSERKVFLNFYENREELKKFKELIAESLPQSITLLKYSTLDPLFSNNAFLNAFENQQPESESPPFSIENQLSNLTQTNHDFMKVNFDHLQIDKVSLREVGVFVPDSGTSVSENTFNLKEVMQTLIQGKLVNDQSISLGASITVQDQRRAFEVILKKVKWENEDAVAVILNDITYQEKLIALKMANVNKDKVIATVSHELRTPLNGIIGLLDITEKKVSDPEITDYLSLCKDNAQLLLSLVNSILDLQQIGSGKLKLNLSQVNIGKVIDGIVKLFQFQCHQKGIYIESTISEELPIHIITDENRFKQILINLIGNAIKFTSKGGIKVNIVEDPEEPERVQVSVIDTGIGIKDSDKEKLFKMYGRLEDGESVNRNGVGLGLTISDALAALLNGKPGERGIEVASKYGEGSTFYFHILKHVQKTKQSPLIFKKGYEENIRKKKQEAFKLFKINSVENDSESRNALKGYNSDTDKSNETNFGNIANELYEEFDTPVLGSKIESYKSIRTISSPDVNSRPHNSSRFTSSIEHPLECSGFNNTQRKKSKFLIYAHKNFVSDVDLLRPQEIKPQLTTFPTTKHIPLKNCIIIVDDNPFNLLIAGNLVKDFGYIVKTALGGIEAIETVKVCEKQGQTIKAILMDCQMPVMDGFETTKILIEMMRRGEINKVPILGWTANNSAEDIKRCYECGMVQHLSKPASQESLFKALSQLE